MHQRVTFQRTFILQVILINKAQTQNLLLRVCGTNHVFKYFFVFCVCSRYERFSPRLERKHLYVFMHSRDLLSSIVKGCDILKKLKYSQWMRDSIADCDALIGRWVLCMCCLSSFGCFIFTLCCWQCNVDFPSWASLVLKFIAPPMTWRWFMTQSWAKWTSTMHAWLVFVPWNLSVLKQVRAKKNRKLSVLENLLEAFFVSDKDVFGSSLTFARCKRAWTSQHVTNRILWRMSLF